ncbi:MAG: T9SS type A sorting domain-containing protein [Bacteroidia bacterium]|nr:T9SS type A sorting domain-containing protein [Bacteroidia bacterium]
MRKNIFKLQFLLFLLLSTFNHIVAQDLWGMTTNGGTDQSGDIIKLDPDGNLIDTINAFSRNYGMYPRSVTLIEPTPGKLYGTVEYGNVNDIYSYGAVYSYDIANKTTKFTPFNKNAKQGYRPNTGLMLGKPGSLYGTTNYGGSGLGVIYRYDLNADTIDVVFEFNTSNNTGSFPTDIPVLASNGKLFGVCKNGGNNNGGVIYEFDMNTKVYNVRHHFTSNSGISPTGNLTEINGVLYGTTTLGGQSNQGVIFSLTLSNMTYKVEFNLDAINTGLKPNQTIKYGNNLYIQMTTAGNNNAGTILEYNTLNKSYKKLHDFTPNSTGKTPGRIFIDTDGTLYGVTFSGGKNNAGTAFKYIQNSNSFVKLLDLDISNSFNHPTGGFMRASDGKLYISASGTNSYDGTLANLNTSDNSSEILYRFGYSQNGVYPVGTLMHMWADKLIGFSQSGGNNEKGTVFMLHTNTKKVETLFHFSNQSGYFIEGYPFRASNSKIYLVFKYGGTSVNQISQLACYDIKTNSFTNIAELSSNSAIGTGTNINFVEINGFLYGFNSYNGANNNGTVFKVNLSNNVVTKILDRPANPQSYFWSQLAIDNQNIYGINSEGGAFNQGQIWNFNINTNTFNYLLDLETDSVGSDAIGIVKVNNKLVVLSSYGGVYGNGVMYVFDIPTKTIIKKTNLVDSLTGYDNYCNLMLSNQGDIFGITRAGGKYDAGAIIKIDTTNFNITITHDFKEYVSAEFNGLYQFKSNYLTINPISNEQLTLFPNPTNGHFEINCSQSIDKIEIFNLDGRIIQNSSSSNNEFDLSGFPTGVYFVKIYLASGQFVHERLLIQ